MLKFRQIINLKNVGQCNKIATTTIARHMSFVKPDDTVTHTGQVCK